MSLLFMDGFDNYVTADITDKWTASTGASINATNGRRGSASLRCGTTTAANKAVVTSNSTAIIGVAVKLSTITGSRLIGIYDGGINRDQAYIGVNADGSLSAYRGIASAGINAGNGTLLGTSAAGLMSVGVSAYIEVKFVIHDTTGAVTVRVNGATVLTLTGQDTSQGSVIWSLIWLASTAAVTADYDDLYVLDGSGSSPWNDFLGDCRVDGRLSTAPGATTGWTPSTGANWQNVDDAAPNDDTDYNSAASVLTDTFTVQDAPVVGATIFGIQHCIQAKKTDAGAGTIAPVIRHAGVDNVGTGQGIGTNYAYILQVNQTNPGTGLAWVEADFNAAEFGYKRLT